MTELQTQNEHGFIEREVKKIHRVLESDYRNLCKTHCAYLIKSGDRRYLELNNFTLFCVLSENLLTNNCCHLDMALYHLTFDDIQKPYTTLRIPIPLLNLDEHRLAFVRYEPYLNASDVLWRDIDSKVGGWTSQQLVDNWIADLLNNAA